MKVLVISYNEEADEGYFLEADIQCPEKIRDLDNDLPFLPERMKMKVEKLISWLFKKLHKIIKFKQKAWLKSYINMNTDLRKKQKMILEKTFKLMSNIVFEKTMKNVRKQRYQTCHNKKKKKLFGLRTNLSYYKSFSQEICWL